MKRFLLSSVFLSLTAVLVATPIQLSEGVQPTSEKGRRHKAPARPLPLEFYPEADIDGTTLSVDVSSTGTTNDFEVIVYDENDNLVDDVVTLSDATTVTGLSAGSYSLEIIVNGSLFYGYFVVE